MKLVGKPTKPSESTPLCHQAAFNLSQFCVPPKSTVFFYPGLYISLSKCWFWFNAVTRLWHSLKGFWRVLNIFSSLTFLLFSHGCSFFFSSAREELIVKYKADLSLPAAWIQPISFYFIFFLILKINFNSTEVIQKVTGLLLFKTVLLCLSLCFSSSSHDFLLK